MGPITSVFPVPKVAPLGGEHVKVSELRLRDLARLQALLDGLEPDPFYIIQDKMSGMTRRERHEALKAAYEWWEGGPPVYGEESGRAYYGSPEGGAAFLYIALRRWKSNRMTPSRAGELFVRATAAQYSQVWRIAHGVTSFQALGKLLMPDFSGTAPQGQAPGRSWGEMVDALAKERGWTYGQIADLTITQWIRARNGGQLPEPARALRPGENWEQIIRRQADFWAGKIDEQGRPIEPDGPIEPEPGASESEELSTVLPSVRLIPETP